MSCSRGWLWGWQLLRSEAPSHPLPPPHLYFFCTFRGVWLLLLAIGSHKFIIALCIGQQLVTNKVVIYLIHI